MFTRVIVDPDDLSSESEDDDEVLRDALEEDFVTLEEVMTKTLEKLPICKQLDAPDGCYDPQGDWDTYFRLDIPVSVVMEAGGKNFVYM